MSKDLWMIEYERALEDFANDADESKVRRRLQALGLDTHEITEEVDAVKGG